MPFTLVLHTEPLTTCSVGRSLYVTQALYLLVAAWYVKIHQAELVKCIAPPQLISLPTGM